MGDFFLVLAFVDFFLALHAFLCTFPVWDVFCIPKQAHLLFCWGKVIMKYQLVGQIHVAVEYVKLRLVLHVATLCLLVQETIQQPY